MGERQPKDWLSLAAALVALVSFALTYFRSDGILFALGLMGFLYLCAAILAIWVAFAVWGLGHRRAFVLLLLPVIALTGLAAGGIVKVAEEHNFSHSIPLHIFGVFVFAIAILFGTDLLTTTYANAHKPCPDCCEVVLVKARVCRHCGFRWRPRPILKDDGTWR